MSKWGWVAAAGLVVLAIASVVALLVRGRHAEAATASADILHAWRKQQVAAKKQRIATLQQQLGANDQRVRTLQAELEAKRAALKQQYIGAGLTSAEIASRFADLDL